MTRILVALCAVALAGCGGTTKTSVPTIDPRAEYQSSLDAYQACVNSNLNNVEVCEDKRVQMETNERAYRNHQPTLPRSTAACMAYRSESNKA